MTNTRDTPVEALERALPMRVRRYALRDGQRRRAARSPAATASSASSRCSSRRRSRSITERRVSAPWGLDGGEPGAPGENWLLPGGDEAQARRLPDKCTVDLAPGDVVRLLTPGGGGVRPELTAR